MNNTRAKRLLSLVLLLGMVLTMLSPMSALAAEAVPDAEDPVSGDSSVIAEAETPTEEPSEDPAETPSEIPAEEPSEEPAETPTEEPSEDPAETPTEEPSETPTEEPVETPAEEPVETPTEEPSEEPAEEPDEKDPEALAEEEAAIAAEIERLEGILAAAQASVVSVPHYTEAITMFPASYRPYLEEMHKNHPNWLFIPLDTGLDWATVIEKEYGSLSTFDYRDGLNSTASPLLLSNHSGHYSGGKYNPVDGPHVACSRAAIAYYMDPRNFLMDEYVFLFENQTYSAGADVDSVQAILKAGCSKSTGLCNMTTYVTTGGATKSLSSLSSKYGSTYAEIIYNIGIAIDINPYFLASKIIQETGGNTTYAALSGKASGYTGIYNFYNIGSYASSTGGAVYNGLNYAKNHGWNNPISALYGGAQFLFDKYVTRGQDSIYLMRFNVGPKHVEPLYTHQYMSAITSTASEATKTYEGYKKADQLDYRFVFYIPVFKNMPEETSVVSLAPESTGKLTADAKLYAAPDTAGNSMVSLPSGTKVTILGGSDVTSDNYYTRLNYPFWYYVKVTVGGKTYNGYVHERAVSLDSDYTVKKGGTLSLSSVTEKSGNVGKVLYETSNPSVATVNDSGTVTAKGTGSCTIYAISTGGSFDAVGITVSSSGVSTPATPKLTSAAVSGNAIVVKWGSVSGATGYTLYRRESSTAGWSPIATNYDGTSYTDDSKLTNGTTYYYTVRAIGASGAQSGYDSTGVSVKYTGTAVPGTPKAPTLTAATDGINVKWTSVSGAASYEIYRKTGSGSWSKIGTSTSASYKDTKNLVSGTTYAYTIRAVSASNVRSGYDPAGTSVKYIPDVKLNPVLPATPDQFSATAGKNYITVKWESISNATSYVLYRKTSSTGWSRVASGITGTSYNDSKDLKSGTTYIYTVRACNSNGMGDYDPDGVSVKYTSKDPTPDTPTLVSATASAKDITVKWKAVPTAESYTVYRKTSDTNWASLKTVTGTSYTDSKDLKSGTTYFYTVRARNSAGLGGYDSKGISVKFTAKDPVPATVKLVSAAASDKNITVKWNAVSGATGYIVYRKNGSNDWARVGSVTGTSFSDTSGLKAGTSYTYTVRAKNGSGLGNYDSKGITVTPSLPGTLKAPTVAVSGKSVSVKWAAASNTTSYTVYRRTASSDPWRPIASNVTGTSYTDSKDLKSGTTYYYTIVAVNAFGRGGYDKTGGSVRFFIATAVPGVPALRSASVSGRTIVVKWNAVAEAESYLVYRKEGTSGWTRVADNITGTSYTDSSALKSGVTYTYTVRAKNSKGLGNYDTKGVSASLQALPDTVKLSSATASSNSVKVTWMTAKNAKTYIIYRKTSNTGWTRLKGDLTGTSYTDSSVVKGTTYTYTVRGVNAAGLGDYDRNGVTVKYSGAVTPATPKLVSASVSGNSIVVKWNTVSGADRYFIYRKSGSSGWTRLTDAAKNGSYTDSSSSLVKGTTYSYTVRAYNAAGLSGFDSTGVSVKFAALGNTEDCVTWSRLNYRSGPGQSYGVVGTYAEGATVKVYRSSPKVYSTSTWYPVSKDGKTYYVDGDYLVFTPQVTGATGNASSITVKWNRVLAAEGYYIYRKTGSGSWAKIATVDGSATVSYTDKSTSLKAGTEYSYSVISFHSSYNSARSGSVTAKLNGGSTGSSVSGTYAATGMVNYRSGPGTTYTLLGTLNEGDKVTVNGSATASNGTVWYKFTRDGKTCYVSSNYMKKV